jgi:hypothetical protein
LLLLAVLPVANPAGTFFDTARPEVVAQAYDVRSPRFGARGDGITNDWAAIQATINAAKVAGAEGLPGGTVFFPPGEYGLSAPLVLPRTEATPKHVVQILGSGPRTTRLRGLSNFPTNRAMIEWDNTLSTQAWDQSIRGIGFLLPNVAGAMAIHYQPNNKSTGAACLAETLSITLEDLLIEGSNQYHQRFIYLEGNVKGSSFIRITGDPTQGTPAHDTALFEFDTADYGAEGDDSAGGTFCSFQAINAMLRRGGYSTVLKGRLLRSSMVDIHGQEARAAATLELDHSSSVTILNYSNEGGGSQPQLKISNSSDLHFVSLGIGTPVDKGLGVGNGVELVNVRDSRFAGVWRRTGNPSFSSFGRRMLTIDAACKRNRFDDWLLTASLANEVENNAPDTNGNFGGFYDIQNSVPYYLGRLAGMTLVP